MDFVDDSFLGASRNLAQRRFSRRRQNAPNIARDEAILGMITLLDGEDWKYQGDAFACGNICGKTSNYRHFSIWDRTHNTDATIVVIIFVTERMLLFQALSLFAFLTMPTALLVGSLAASYCILLLATILASHASALPAPICCCINTT